VKTFRWAFVAVALIALGFGVNRFRSVEGTDSATAADSAVGGPSTQAGDLEIGRIMAHLDFLASEELQGRGNGSPGASAAATYIEDQFKLIGLEPSGQDGFFHDYQVYTGVRVQGAIGMRDNARGYEYVKDYAPLGMSSDGTHQSELVFVGYGVTAPEHNYDDYAAVDVKGKIVLALLGEPGLKDPESPFDGTTPTSHSDLYTKAANAAAHGAAGLLLTAGPEYARGADNVWRISQEQGYLDTRILVCHVSRAAARSLVEPAGLDLGVAQVEIDKSYRPVSSLIPNQQVELKVALRRLKTNLRNVIGKIPGRTEQSILLLANYDGHGMGEDNAVPVFHPSANENASGVAALIELARTFRSGPPPEKTLYFGCLSGRRLTFAGADGLVRDEVFGSAKIEVVINQFALGSINEAQLEVLGVSSGRGLETVVHEAAKGLRAPVDLRVLSAISRSGDHIPFYKEGIPTLTIFGGAFEEYGTPKDTPDRIDRGNLLRRTLYVRQLLERLSASESVIAFQR